MPKDNGKRPKRPTRLRPTYREHTQEEIRSSFSMLGQVALDYLWEISTRPVNGDNEYQRGIEEGQRRLAGELLGYTMPTEAAKVERNLEG